MRKWDEQPPTPPYLRRRFCHHRCFSHSLIVSKHLLSVSTMSLSARAELSRCFVTATSVKPNFDKFNTTVVTSLVVRSPISRVSAVFSVSWSRKISKIVAKASQGLTYRDIDMDIDAGSELVRKITKRRWHSFISFYGITGLQFKNLQLKNPNPQFNSKNSNFQLIFH